MKKILKGIIPAAGLGIRMRVLSQKIPKEMLPIGKRPMIEYAIMDMVKSGIEEITIITHPEKKIMNDYISEFIKKEFESKPNTPKIYFINQTKRQGLAHAIYLAKDFIGQQPFAVFLSDNLIQPPIEKKNIYQPLINLLFERKVNTVAIEKVESEGYANLFGNCGRIKFTSISSSVFRIDKIADKMPGKLSLKGEPFIFKTIARNFYLPEIFSYIENFMQSENLEEYDDVPILKQLVKEGKLYGVPYKCRVCDVGNPKGYQAAQRDFRNTYEGRRFR